MACHLAGAKPSFEPMLEYCNYTIEHINVSEILRKLYVLIQGNAFQNVVWKNVGLCVSASMY